MLNKTLLILCLIVLSVLAEDETPAKDDKPKAVQYYWPYYPYYSSYGYYGYPYYYYGKREAHPEDEQPKVESKKLFRRAANNWQNFNDLHEFNGGMQKGYPMPSQFNNNQQFMQSWH